MTLEEIKNDRNQLCKDIDKLTGAFIEKYRLILVDFDVKVEFLQNKLSNGLITCIGAKTSIDITI